MALDILVPYWGDPDLMRETVESVFAQERDDWRLTVVDDAYPDRQISQWLSDMDDPRVSVVRHDANVGITANYRECLARATQDHLMFLGSDDVLLPTYVGVVLDAFAAVPEAVMVQPGVRVVDETGTPSAGLADTVKQRLLRPRGTSRTVLSGESLAASLLTGNWLYWPSIAFRRSAVQEIGFRVELPIIQDFALEIDLVAGGGTLVVDPTECFLYRRHAGSASSTTLVDGTRFADERAYYAMAVDQMRALGWKRAERAARARLTSRAHALSLLPAVLVRRQWSAARQLGRHAVAPTAAPGAPPAAS
ncbi:MAG TPA: glycosyltransferase [Lapillicoccus sp.]|nr:glycosyltransferase [Lapillicoccus sp.]